MCQKCIDKIYEGKEEYYSASVLETPVLDPTKYQGHGRPRKSDYSPISVIKTKLDSILNTILDRRSLTSNRSQ